MASKLHKSLKGMRSERQAYRALWAAVVVRAMQDVRGENLLSDGYSPEGLAMSARYWLTSGPGQVVCEALGIPAPKVREVLSRV